MEYQSTLPYPEINITVTNKNYAETLQYAYAGNLSEETAVHQYLYQSFLFDNEISKILENIAIVEMHHVDLLATMIKQLGTAPKFVSNNLENKEIAWTSEYVPYPLTIEEALKLNIKSETMAIANYRTIIRYIPIVNVQEVIERIILDEQIHLKIFQDLLKKVQE